MVNPSPVRDGRKWDLWQVVRIGWGHKGGVLTKGISALQGSQEHASSLTPKSGQKIASVYNQEKSLVRPNHATPGLILPASKTG